MALSDKEQREADKLIKNRINKDNKDADKTLKDAENKAENKYKLFRKNPLPSKSYSIDQCMNIRVIS